MCADMEHERFNFRSAWGSSACCRAAIWRLTEEAFSDPLYLLFGHRSPLKRFVSFYTRSERVFLDQISTMGASYLHVAYSWIGS